METFEDITCEDYAQAWGSDGELFADWVANMESFWLDAVNTELREVANDE